MKKTLVAVAALVATGAFAQSTVTIGGLVDVGVKNVNKVAPGASTTSIGSGNNNRIIFSVTEDLGGGLKALANAQMRFDPTTGTAEGNGARPLFQGETRLGLSGGFGTTWLGRGLTALQSPNGSNSDPFGVTTVAGSVYAAGFATDYAAGGEARIDQAVWYVSPSLSGLTLSATYSPKKLAAAGSAATADTATAQGANAVTAITTARVSTSLNALYAVGTMLNAGVGYERNRVGDSITQFYGNYDLTAVKLFASYATIRGGSADDRAGVTFAAAAAAVNSGAKGASNGVAANGAIKNVTFGATVPMGKTSLRAGYSVWNGNGSANQEVDSKLGLGVKYDLSNRTYVYTDMANQSRKNNTGATPNTDNTKITSLDLGVSHTF